MYAGLSAGTVDADAAGRGAAAAVGALGMGLPSYFMASLYPVEVGSSSGGGVLEDRTVCALRNHREAEKRRRERIKSHLDRLRSILACDPKIDKASLLAKTVERVRDLKEQTANIAGAQLFPTESDEIVVLPTDDHFAYSGGRRSVFKASFCCDDRSDLLPELIDTLRSLRLKTLRAEIATVGGRVRNVIVVAGEQERSPEDDQDESCFNGGFLRDALKEIVERRAAMSGDQPKRRRVVLDGSTV